MARSVRIKSIEQRGKYWRIHYGKSVVEIPGKNKAALKRWIREQLEDSDELILAISLAAWIRRDPELMSPETVVGKTGILDLEGNLDSVDGIVRLSNG